MLVLFGARGESEQRAFGGVVADVVHLEGGVLDAELVGEQLLEVAPAGVAVLGLDPGWRPFEQDVR